ncbi:hypothetical protein [Actinoplanes subtropicus]|uniref:hypothetical protein n=1 Tax=Actinoplanes subtropicus TaxID=543632 RepID=UPI0004C32509|nr:hypothetical protein [Actinoplanes subtropicus]
MSTFVIDVPVAVRLVTDRSPVPAGHALIAPALLRSHKHSRRPTPRSGRERATSAPRGRCSTAALVTMDEKLAAAAGALVPVRTVAELLGSS